ncbi:hypothetical protein KY334_03925 [Candidatus Woesearchaeota archaeon]|nr:hypothetical protein [Candidatus Woesearchaeota archaeon]
MEINIPVKYSETIDLALDTMDKDKQALIFVNTKSSAEKQAEEISKKIDESKEEWDFISKEALQALSTPTKQCKRLADCLKKGIAFHHSGLNNKQRELIEDNFRNGVIKIICCTPTLAAGLDLPAYRAILKDLKRFTSQGMRYIPVLEYLQMAGRAGRPKFDTIGEAICICKDENQKEEIENMYIYGKAEDIYSKLAAEPVLRTYVLSLIATEFVKDKEQLMDFFKKTFFAHQYKDLQQMELLLMRVIAMLEEWEFIKVKKESNDSFFSSADSLGKEEYTATLVGKRVSELYLDPLTANELIKGLNKSKSKNEFSYLHLVSNTLEMRPLLSVTKKESEDLEEKTELSREFILNEDDLFEDYYYFMSSVKTAWFFEDWISEKSEDKLMEKFNIRPGEIKFKCDIADWLLYSCHELANILMLKEQLSDITKLRLRLKYGVKEELLPLVKIKNIGKNRARKLFDNGFKSIKELRKADLSTLKLLVGDKTAVNIKKQLLMN